MINIALFENSARSQRRGQKVATAVRPIFSVIDLRKWWRVSHLPVLLGLFGGAVLAAGADAPLIHIPIVGTISYLHHPGYFTFYKIGELVILLAAALSIVCVLLRRFELLWLTGTAAIAQLIATVATFQHTTATVVAKASKPDLVDPTLMWAGAALQHSRFEWGVAMVGGGALMVLAAAAWEFRTARRKRRAASGPTARRSCAPAAPGGRSGIS
jgi:hypothetical protein